MHTSLIPRLLGVFFYYPPASSAASRLIPALARLDTLFDWDDAAQIGRESLPLAAVDPSAIAYDFSALFEGQGAMHAPPWGSVYLEKENLLMGQSTQLYRDFLALYGMSLETEIEEPLDQFGLMLMAFALLVENGEAAAGRELLSDHLLTWSPRYLELLACAKTEHPFYPSLAHITAIYLDTLKTRLDLRVKKAMLYF